MKIREMFLAQLLQPKPRSFYCICHAVLCCVMLCHAMSCYVMLCYGLLCYVLALRKFCGKQLNEVTFHNLCGVYNIWPELRIRRVPTDLGIPRVYIVRIKVHG